MMKVSIIQPDLDIGNTYSFEFLSSVDELDVASDQYSVDGSMEIKGTVVHTGKGYRVEGNIHFWKTFQCDCCLENSSSEQVLSFLETYKKDGEESGNEDMVSFSGDLIDITELIRETILLSVPLKHICSPDCRGLCIKCGANLNKTECGCDRHVIDPRLAALQKLLNQK